MNTDGISIAQLPDSFGVMSVYDDARFKKALGTNAAKEVALRHGLTKMVETAQTFDELKKALVLLIRVI